MASRKVLKGILHAIIGSFISRNNDVSGYWAIGKLYALMEARDTQELKIDILSKKMEPGDEEFDSMLSVYKKMLSSQIGHLGLEGAQVQEAKILLQTFPDEPIPYLKKSTPHRIYCQCLLRDDLNKTYSYKTDVWCWAHDPNKEHKSGR